MEKRRGTIKKRLCLSGLLATGAPAGYLVYSYFLFNPASLDFINWVRYLLTEEQILLLYLTIPTMVVFLLFGYWNAKNEDAIQVQHDQMEELLHIAAHDIRSPLAVIRTAAESVQEDPHPISGRQERFINMIKQETMIIHELVELLLDIHRMEVGEYMLQKQRTNIKELIQQSVEEMRLLAEEKAGKINLKSHIPDDTMLNVDQFRIWQVMRNILNNGIRYIPEGGEINVELKKEGSDDLEIMIQNNGPHIPSDRLNEVFDKYFQVHLHDRALGAGLGLSICKNIMELHGGKIWAENLEPTGVAFHCRLPKD